MTDELKPCYCTKRSHTNCPVCHCKWFSTVSDADANIDTHEFQCKNCGHKYLCKDAVALSNTCPTPVPVQFIEGIEKPTMWLRKIEGNLKALKKHCDKQLGGGLNLLNDAIKSLGRRSIK